MSAFEKPIAFVKAHPVGVGIGVFALGLIFILMNRGSGSSSSGDDAGNLSGFYAAQAAQAQSGDAVQAIQIQSQAQTAQALAADDAAVNITTLNTNASTAMNANNNATLLGLAPYNVQAAGISALGSALSNTPSEIQTQSTTKNNGFFGIGGSTKVSTQVNPNPVYSNLLDEFNSLFSAMH